MLATSRPAVHPVDTLPPAAVEAEAPAAAMVVRLKEIQGMPATPGGLALRIAQAAFAAASVAVMATTPGFASANAFRYLVAAAGFQVLWSLSLAALDIYALLVKRCLQNPTILCFFTIGDGITAALTFGAACSSAGITVLLGNDLSTCGENPCTNFEVAAAMAFLSSFAVSPSFFLNFWTLAAK